jgi:hypothetical protein
MNELESAVMELIQNNGGPIDSLEGSDTYVMVRKADFERLAKVMEKRKRSD